MVKYNIPPYHAGNVKPRLAQKLARQLCHLLGDWINPGIGWVCLIHALMILLGCDICAGL